MSKYFAGSFVPRPPKFPPLHFVSRPRRRVWGLNLVESLVCLPLELPLDLLLDVRLLGATAALPDDVRDAFNRDAFAAEVPDILLQDQNM